MSEINRMLLNTGKTAGAGPVGPRQARCRRPFLVRRGDGRPQLLHEKSGRSLNQPVGRHDANGVGDGHIQTVK